MKTDVAVADYLPYGAYRANGRWAEASVTQVAERRRWLQRVEGLAGSRVRRLLGDLNGDAAPASAVFTVGFDPVPRLWSSRSIQGGLSLGVQLHVPDSVFDVLNVDQAATLIQGFAGSVIQARFAAEPRMQLVEGGPFPMVSIVAIPRCGDAAVWHRDPNVDAFAKTVSVVNGIWRQSALWGTAQSGWPIVELVPSRGSGTSLLAGFGRVAVGIAGFAGLPDSAQLETILEGVRRGVSGRWGSEAPPADDSSEQVTTAILDWVGIHGLRGAWVSPALAGSSGSDQVRAEYVEDGGGARVRAIVETGGRTITSPWHPAGVDLHHITLLAPNDGFRWSDANTVEVTANPFTGRCFRFEPRFDREGSPATSAVTPSLPEQPPDGALPVAHSAFSAHFTDPIYEDAAAEFGPFGSDEGFQVIHDWSGRASELDLPGTLAPMITEIGIDEPERWRRPIRTRDQSEASRLIDQAVLIHAAGFALLRLTGRIDPAGKKLVLNALDFLISYYDAPAEYVTQRDDLARWVDDPPAMSTGEN